jgi:hypothetical protein
VYSATAAENEFPWLVPKLTAATGKPQPSTGNAIVRKARRQNGMPVNHYAAASSVYANPAAAARPVRHVTARAVHRPPGYDRQPPHQQYGTPQPFVEIEMERLLRASTYDFHLLLFNPPMCN